MRRLWIKQSDLLERAVFILRQAVDTIRSARYRSTQDEAALIDFTHGATTPAEVERFLRPTRPPRRARWHWSLSKPRFGPAFAHLRMDRAIVVGLTLSLAMLLGFLSGRWLASH